MIQLLLLADAPSIVIGKLQYTVRLIINDIFNLLCVVITSEQVTDSVQSAGG